ncbi:MAG: OsmC family protein [Dehalococcoidia bacterium]|nr:OsmC family protein [Dehalococcoidia bacterium]MCA9829988.1 OsmC family protein [Dehalococcoidia bacterium]MCB9486793.1 OsmC family protein [Thermoflexaceae bacterium]
MATSVIVQSLADYTHAQLVTMPGAAFVTDEPTDVQGNDFGPTPYELLTAALGACTAMTLQMYARRKGYPLQEVAVEVEHDRVHADDCEECNEPREGRIDVFRRKIVLRGPLDDAQREDLLRIASRCPVHKTLQNQPEIFDTLEVVA